MSKDYSDDTRPSPTDEVREYDEPETKSSDEVAISLPVTFHLPAGDEFWNRMADEAARLDVENGSDPQDGYTHAQALVVVFHQDGLETIRRLAHEAIPEHSTVGWSVDTSWDALPKDGHE